MMNTTENVNVDVLDVDSDSIAIRLVPTAPSAAMLDGELAKRQVQLLVKSEDQRKAMEQIEELTEQYKDLPRNHYTPYNNKYRMISADVYTEPNFVDKIDNRFYVYTSILQFEMERMI
ncbi:hypothetical protein PBC1_013 [Bacillus phage PBC1]|uniref:Uncharacterized protein n=1 Tax=Bacillus phage PBC1 TaxID=1161901 RepID=I1TLE7_9CAUD|nr:minor head protein [Bacillus phage PBC1]AFE86249.1 hypothetical protein PBC1_013 [Bacillus phage PBC1]